MTTIYNDDIRTGLQGWISKPKGTVVNCKVCRHNVYKVVNHRNGRVGLSPGEMYQCRVCKHSLCDFCLIRGFIDIGGAGSFCDFCWEKWNFLCELEKQA